MIGGALGYLRDWGLMMLVNLSQFQLVSGISRVSDYLRV
jgi:hypothetical protein